MACSAAVHAQALLPSFPQFQQQPPAAPKPPAPPTVSDNPVDAAKVDAALKKSIAWLYAQQKPDGSWETVAAPEAKIEAHSVTSGQWGGLTALATYALLSAGESSQDPRLVKAVDFLKKAEIKGIYALGLRGQIWQFLPKRPETTQMAKRDAQLLLASCKTEPRNIGKYHYLLGGPKGGGYDHSVSQFGVLGVWGAALAGVEVPTKYWQAVEDGWIKDQHKGTGGWQYIPSDDAAAVTATMTQAGVATLFVTQDYLGRQAVAQCKGNISNPAIDAAIKWLSTNYETEIGKRHIFYALYGSERIGVAGGYKYFGKTDWYRYGVNYLLPKQSAQGAWNDLSNTAFSTIFLARGRAPVAFNKLQYSIQDKGKAQEGHWNQRPRDVANVTKWIANQIEGDLNWQIVNLAGGADDLHDSQILLIAGDEKLSFSDADVATLKSYVEGGGMIVGHADCGSKPFAAGFRELAGKMFPVYEPRDLPESHALYNIQFKRTGMKSKPRWQGVTNGTRELMVLIPEDQGKSWQMQTVGGKEHDFQTMANLFLYSIDINGARQKGLKYIVERDPKVVAKSTLAVARGEYNGNWDPEPGGWRRMSNILLNEKGINVDVKPVKLGTGKLDKTFKVLHLTGTTKMQFDEAARKEIKQFVTDGGTVVVDAAGGNGEFATSVERELAMLWPDATKQMDQPLKPDHALFAAASKVPNLPPPTVAGKPAPAAVVAKPMTEFTYRDAFRRAVAGAVRDPRLRGIEVNGRLAVLYSREDLSTGMVGMPIDGILGYTPESATEMMKNVLLYAASNVKK